jgi:hypothetical protein
MTNDLCGDGVIIIDGAEIETVYYWLTVVAEAGPVIAEGSITGSERVMKLVRKAAAPKLVMVDGPTLILQCEGGRGGVRWVKALAAPIDVQSI